MTVHPFVQTGIDRIPVYGSWRVAAIGVCLAMETLTRADEEGNKLIKPLRVFKSLQIIACLGATPIFKSYWVSIPATATLLLLATTRMGGLIDKRSKPKVNKAIIRMDICTKVVSVFAVGLFAKHLFDRKGVSTVAMAVSSIAMFGLSVYNVYPWKTNEHS